MPNESAANDITPNLTKQFAYSIGKWTLNTHTNQLIQGDRTVDLEHRLTNLLVYFLLHRHEVLTKDDILKAIWPNKVVNDDSLAVAISQLRKALEDNPRTPTYIKTIPGIGYQFIMQPAEEEPAVTARTPLGFHPHKNRYFPLFLLLVILIIGLATLFSVNFSALKNSRNIPQQVEQTAGLYERALALLQSRQKEDWRSAITLFHQSIYKNLEVGKSYLGIAEAKINLLNNRVTDKDSNDEIRALLLKALELDPSLARAHQWLAKLLIWHDHNYIEAEKHFKTSLEINPKDDWAHANYAHLLLIQKRFAEARTQTILARTLNPLRYASSDIAFIYLAEGNYELAANELERISSTEQEDYFFHTTEQNIYYSSGNEQKTFENMQWFFKKEGFSTEKISTLNQLFTQGGLTAVYRWLLDTKETADVGQYTPPISWARYAAAIGEKQLAIDYLEQAYNKNQPHVECANADPRYAPLYDEERFKRLIEKLSQPVTK